MRHTRQVLHSREVWVLDVPLGWVEVFYDFQHLLDIFTMFLTSLVKVAPCFELTGRPDIGGLELRIYLTLGRRPDDIEVFGLINNMHACVGSNNMMHAAARSTNSLGERNR